MSFDPEGYVLSPDGGDALWFLDTRMTVKAGGAQTGGAFTVLEWAAPSGFGPPSARRGRSVLRAGGEMALTCGDRSWTAGPGCFVFLPHGIAHAFTISDGPVPGLLITAPAAFEQSIAHVGRPAEDAGLPMPSVPDVPCSSRLVSATGTTSSGHR
jgi:hypothetical protein